MQKNKIPMNRITNEELKAYNDTYVGLLRTVVNQMEIWRMEQIAIMREHDWDTEKSEEIMRDFAGQSFFHAMRKAYEENYLCESNVQAARMIIKLPPNEGQEHR